MEKDNRKYNINELAAKWLEGTITPDEKAYYEKWYAGINDEQSTITSEQTDSGELMHMRLKKRIHAKLFTRRQKFAIPTVRMAAAATVLILITFGAYYYGLFDKKSIPAQKQQLAKNHTNAILPGSNKAVLTLADGSNISLTDAGLGTISRQGNTLVSKTADGKVAYEETDRTTSAITYNTISVPKGGWFEIILPDGSQVTLNAGSTLKFPTVFNTAHRTVALTGEAYFKVVHQPKAPFQVKTARQLVEDIGTQFNISAYADEPTIKTTLIEGSASVHTNTQNRNLTAGQQAINNKKGELKFIRSANTEAAVAWKNGNFQFDNADIREIMRSIGRWYNVDIVFQDNYTDQQFSGTISKYANVESTLAMIEATGAIHFKIQGRRITVMP